MAKKNLSTVYKNERIRELEALVKAMALDTPHPLPDVFERLIAATDHLFVAHGCDEHGWEIWQAALREAHGLLDGLRAALRNRA